MFNYAFLNQTVPTSQLLTRVSTSQPSARGVCLLSNSHHFPISLQLRKKNIFQRSVIATFFRGGDAVEYDVNEVTKWIDSDWCDMCSQGESWLCTNPQTKEPAQTHVMYLLLTINFKSGNFYQAASATGKGSCLFSDVIVTKICGEVRVFWKCQYVHMPSDCIIIFYFL